MREILCPACGAPARFRAAASVMCVCTYCRSTVVKDAESVKDLGKMSQVLEDFSPLQIGVSGKYQDVTFTVIGRIQLRYEAGLWNEWYLYFDDGRGGWLFDGGGLMVLSFSRGLQPAAPAFETLQPFSFFTFEGKQYDATDVRIAQCVGGEGELPFVVGAGWQAKVADLRSRDAFVTLDYSQGEVPELYLGEITHGFALALQGLRSDEDIERTSGQYRGLAKPLNCPSCGAALTYRSGVAQHVVCDVCATATDVTGGLAQVVAAQQKLERLERSSALKLGEQHMIRGARFEVIGFLQRRAVGGEEESVWMEYLLASRGRLLWLIEANGAWSLGEAQAEWPLRDPAAARLGQREFSLVDRYTAEVVYAVGAFNWRVQAGDRHEVLEYENGRQRLVFEKDAAEASCTMVTVLDERALQSIGLADVPSHDQRPASFKLDGSPTFNFGDAGFYFAMYLVLSFGRVSGNDGDLGGRFWLVSLLVAFLLWLPWCFLPKSEEPGLWSRFFSGDDD